MVSNSNSIKANARLRHSQPKLVSLSVTKQQETKMTDFHNIKMLDIQGSEVNFADYTGKTCLIVNVASR
jgi:hypothetical protein